jgi:putative membrane protein insertion efficiency factor
MRVDSLLGPVRRAPRRAARGLVTAYRYSLSPLVGFHCRHLPTCSAYADEALDRFGLWAGGWMTLARLCRCQPWGTCGLDLVPEALTPGARWYAPWRYARWRGTNARAPFSGTAEPGAVAENVGRKSLL